MNSTVKTILIWLLILAAAVGLYQIVERGGAGRQTTLSLTEFLSKVEAGGVSAVTIQGSNVTGRLRDNSEFRLTIPQGYAAVYDQLTAHNVQVRIIPADSSPWLGSFILTSGLILWFAISVVILVVLVDLSRFLKRQLARSGGSPAST
jgi:cell division protease FtsH